MEKQFSRTALLLGDDGIQKLKNARVAVFGIGGVGGHAVEALARAGVGALDLIDHDTVSESNINRQMVATWSTVGKYKTDVARDRVLDINPNCKVTVHQTFYLPETESEFDFTQYDYVIDAVDTVTAKISLIAKAQACGTPIICSMGAGNKLDPTKFRVSDISKTEMDPLAKVIRRKLKELGIAHVKVVWSDEQPLSVCASEEAEQPGAGKHSVPGSISFVPSVAGLILAGEVIKDICGIKKQ